jgi:hypothetical protein
VRTARPLFLVVVVGVAVVAATSAFVLGRSRSDEPLPYTAVRYGASDARRAFAAQGVAPVMRSRSAHSKITGLGNARDVLEVTVFGNAEAVRASGFRDLEHGTDCTVEGHLALHWHGNVRAILNCDLVRDDTAWIARMDRALEALR